MKALMYTAVGKLEMTEIPEPSPGYGEVCVRVGATGICGSDVHGFLGHQARRQPGLVLGHETMGRVESVGPGVEGDLVGRRVAVNPLITCGTCTACRIGRQSCCSTWRLLGMDRLHGGFAEWIVVPARNVQPLADHVTDAQAVMIEPLANAVHLVSKAPQSAGLMPTAVVLGGGTLGACILSVALERGIRVIAVSEPNPARAAVALELGAPRVIDPRTEDLAAEVNRLTDGAGVDLVFDAVGLAVTRVQAASLVSRGGSVLLLGLDEGPTTFNFQDLIRREVAILCSFAYGERDFAEAFDLVERRAVDYSPWTTAQPLEQGQAAFDRLVKDPGDRIKIVLTP